MTERKRRHNDPLRIRNVRYTEASPEEAEEGLLGWVGFAIGDGMLFIDGVMVRRTAFGTLTLSYPRRLDPGGGQHFFVRPLDDAARRFVEREVFRKLRLSEEPTD